MKLIVKDSIPYQVEICSKEGSEVLIKDIDNGDVYTVDESEIIDYKPMKLIKDKEYQIKYTGEQDVLKIGQIVKCLDDYTDEELPYFTSIKVEDLEDKRQHIVYAYQLCEKEYIDKEYENGNHASYYGGEDNPYEAIKVIKAWSKQNNWNGEQGFCFGNVLKYISRAGMKKGNTLEQDITKCINYLEMYLKKER